MTFNLQTLQHTSGTYHKETSPKNFTPRPACIHQIFDFPISYQTHRVEEPSRHTIDQAYSTFYKTNLSWKIAHSKYRQKRQKNTATPDRHSVVGTPFTSADLSQKDPQNGLFPIVDREHYHYIVKAISGIKRGRQLSQLRSKIHHNPQDAKLQRFSFQPVSDHENHSAQVTKTDLCMSPKIFNLKPQLATRRADRGSLDSKNNIYQKICRNKNKLHNRYFQRKTEEQRLIGLTKEELKVHQIGWSPLKHNQKISS